MGDKNLTMSNDNTNNQNTQELIMYILVNKDLEMSTGKIAGQVGHVITEYFYDVWLNHSIKTMEISGKKPYQIRENYIKWYNSNQKKIILKAPQKLLEKLENNYFAIRDLGLTEIESNNLTAVCLGIGTRDEFYEKISKLKRLRLL